MFYYFVWVSIAFIDVFRFLDVCWFLDVWCFLLFSDALLKVLYRHCIETISKRYRHTVDIVSISFHIVSFEVLCRHCIEIISTYRRYSFDMVSVSFRYRFFRNTVVEPISVRVCVFNFAWKVLRQVSLVSSYPQYPYTHWKSMRGREWEI